MCDNAVWPPLPFYEVLAQFFAWTKQHTIKTEGDEQGNADNEVGAYIWTAPWMCPTCPIKCKEHQRGSGDKQEGANRVACPCPLVDTHARVVGTFLGPVECKQTERCDAM